MKITNKELNLKKDKISIKNNSLKVNSRSLTRVKPASSVLAHSPTKKGKQLQIIKQKNQTPKKKKEEKTKKKKTNYCLNLKELKPVNLQKQKELFFENHGKYNPFFIYPNISDLNDDEYKDMRKYQKADEQFLRLAIKILEKSMEIGFVEMIAFSEKLTQKETSVAFDQYINKLGIQNLLTYQFAQNTIAPTSVIHNNQECMSRVIIGLPINYRKVTIEGVLNHEIGTHFLRKHNDRAQKWHKDRKKYDLGPYLQTEQGLAGLNQLCAFIMQDTAALLYYSCYLASKLSFSQLYEAISKYQPDPQYRWRECVRVKRGVADTSKTTGMFKDQIYFMGAIEILQHRRQLNFYHLYSGKISVDDCLRLTSKGHINDEKLKLPTFISNLKHYLKCLDLIAQTNMVDSFK